MTNINVLPQLSVAAQQLSADILTATEGQLTKTGNRIDQQHRQGLTEIADMLSVSYTDSPKMRMVNDLYTGGGKSTSIASLVTVLCERYRDTNYSGRGILIAVGTTEQADSLMESILSSQLVMQLHERKPLVGTYHSDSSATLSSKKSAKNIPFVIVTHERIKMQDYDSFIDFDNHQRLIIWDEALIATKSSVILIKNLLEEIGKLYTHFETKKYLEDEIIDSSHQEILKWLLEIKARFLDIEEDQYVQLPDRPSWIRRRMLQGDRPLSNSEFKRIFYGHESEILLTLINAPFRSVRVNSKSHAFWFVVQIPDEFEDIVILDASASIRKLLHSDTNMHIIPSSASKDYSDVTIHFCRCASGRNTVDDDCKNDAYYKEIQHIAENLVPSGNDLLAFHLPQKINSGAHSADHESNLKECAGNIRPWSWGKAKATNELSIMRYGTHIGIVYREEKELACNVAGQSRNSELQLSKSEIRDIQISEHADQVFQAISRMQNRCTKNSKALPSDFWLFYKDESILDLLREVMPNVTVVEYHPVYIQATGRIGDPIANQMLSWLQDTSPMKISIQTLRKELGISLKPTDRLWTQSVLPSFRALACSIGYEVEGRSLVRKAA
jgi:hypothetical protein